MAYFWKWEGMSFPRILQQHVDHYYRFRSLQIIYENNIFPIIQDRIQYDCQTKPPQVWTKQAGCPKKKRMTKCSKFIDEDSPILCSICGQGRHNMRICLNAVPSLGTAGHETIAAI